MQNVKLWSLEQVELVEGRSRSLAATPPLGPLSHMTCICVCRRLKILQNLSTSIDLHPILLLCTPKCAQDPHMESQGIPANWSNDQVQIAATPVSPILILNWERTHFACDGSSQNHAAHSSLLHSPNNKSDIDVAKGDPLTSDVLQRLNSW